MNLARLCGHNPNSKSAKARAEREKLLTVGTVKCCKCGDVHTTLFKIEQNGKKEYICKNCKTKLKGD